MHWPRAKSSSMQYTHLAAPFLAILLAGCVHNAPDSTLTHAPLGWLQGCWQTEDGTEETWAQSIQGDQLFGYSVTSNKGQRVFFEQLRIDFRENHATLSAYPRGVGPTPFEATLTGQYSVEFINADNDYPQRIRYAFVNEGLEASIALLDNTRLVTWNYHRCN